MSEGEGGVGEERLERLREEALRHGTVGGAGVQPRGSPFPSRGERPGYHGRPALKPPVWTWEIPLYLFVGGMAGGCGMIALGAHLDGEGELARAALWTALFGLVASAALLVSDLGRPRRFLHMLRVFKWRSPMSVGVWILTGYGGAVTVALTLAIAQDDAPGTFLLLTLAACAAGGALLATYTGVLLAATAVPAWHRHRGALPVHFGVAGLGSAGALLELLGHGAPALPALGLAAAIVEILLGGWLELSRRGPGDAALRSGRAGLLLRVSLLLAGPLSLGLRLTGLATGGALAFLVGALLSRFGWLEAGKASALDPLAALAQRR